jgi:putative transposase
MSVCYNTPKAVPITVTGVVGVDRNSVGNVAVIADIGTGKVLKFGLCPARTKAAMCGRRKNLQKAGKFRLLNKLRRKQRRRMAYENHRASKSVVDYAVKHRRAVAIENLNGVRAEGSKIRRYSEKSQWAFAQMETFLRYKCALHGVPVIEVNPAYTSQDCSRCGSRHKPTGKRFSCGTCGHNDHRDANAAFNISRAGWSGLGLSVPGSGCIGNAQAGKDGVL